MHFGRTPCLPHRQSWAGHGWVPVLIVHWPLPSGALCAQGTDQCQGQDPAKVQARGKEQQPGLGRGQARAGDMGHMAKGVGEGERAIGIFSYRCVAQYGYVSICGSSLCLSSADQRATPSRCPSASYLAAVDQEAHPLPQQPPGQVAPEVVPTDPAVEVPN